MSEEEGDFIRVGLSFVGKKVEEATVWSDCRKQGFPRERKHIIVGQTYGGGLARRRIR